MIKLSSNFSLLAINFALRFISIKMRGVGIGHGSWIKSYTEIGYGTGVGWNFCVRGSGRLIVGKYCAIGENVRVITSNHETNCLALNYALQSKIIGKRLVGNKLDVIVGNDVWIGDQAIILPGVVIGNGAIVGAGAVVTKSVEPFNVVAGNPAIVIRKRFDQNFIDEIMKLKWWEWSFAEFKKNKQLFEKR